MQRVALHNEKLKYFCVQGLRLVDVDINIRTSTTR